VSKFVSEFRPSENLGGTMRRSTSRAFQYFFVPGLLLCLALAVLANNSRNFSGVYRIIKATDQGDNVEVQLSLRVVNHSAPDVKGATISLRSSVKPSPGPTEAWEKEATPFTNIALNFNEHKRVPPLEGTFTVPAEVYKQWQKGRGPNFVIDYLDSSGKAHHEEIEVSRMP
jgi:hypothetical protein